ncbi:uncharacterized protein SPSK_02891 [Sporothrix schenckii 1099-18]|uniref:Uncharacterized protein n=1 Tax=Sporothrix schenckii 1099-18 TaxID=1397361 RepID=A0A0F2MC96_SPOSC|nr:uncharacterized protein SPSK_02891 [Sporothrix schenckii 1099-18]KJR86435.1 hypothetical protein SPSK_02891 [Sporothrix schenckii 1099-18]
MRSLPPIAPTLAPRNGTKDATVDGRVWAVGFEPACTSAAVVGDVCSFAFSFCPFYSFTLTDRSRFCRGPPGS